MDKDRVQVTKVNSKVELVDFIKLPHKIYQKDHNWSGQKDWEIYQSFDPNENIALKYMDIQPFIAKINNVVVGRICGIVCPAFNQRWEKQTAYFGYFETIDDLEVASGLFDAVRDWALERNCNEIWGPLTMNTSGVVGLLITDFQKKPTYGYPYNPPYYSELLINYGYVKERDLFEMTCQFSDFYENAIKYSDQVEHLQNDPDYRIRPINKTQLHQELIQVAELHPRCFYNHWGYRKIETDEFVDFLASYLHNLSKKFLFVVEHTSNFIGFCIVHLEKNDKTHNSKLPEKINISVLGVDMAYHGKKIGQWMYTELANWFKKYNFKVMSLGWIEEENIPSLNAVAKLGGIIDKKYRVFSIRI